MRWLGRACFNLFGSLNHTAFGTSFTTLTNKFMLATQP